MGTWGHGSQATIRAPGIMREMPRRWLSMAISLLHTLVVSFLFLLSSLPIPRARLLSRFASSPSLLLVLAEEGLRCVKAVS